MIEGEDDASSGPKRNGRHFLGRLYQLRGWPPGWHSWTSELDEMFMTGTTITPHLPTVVFILMHPC